MDWVRDLPLDFRGEFWRVIGIVGVVILVVGNLVGRWWAIRKRQHEQRPGFPVLPPDERPPD